MVEGHCALSSEGPSSVHRTAMGHGPLSNQASPGAPTAGELEIKAKITMVVKKRPETKKRLTKGALHGALLVVNSTHLGLGNHTPAIKTRHRPMCLAEPTNQD